MIPLRIDELVRAVGGRMPLGDRRSSRPAGSPLADRVAGVSTDTRTLKPGEVFVALAGENFDGHAFVSEAFARGARAGLVAESAVSTLALDARHESSVILVDDPRAALGRLAAYCRRSALGRATNVIAVTGSNGKTTTKGMIDHVLGTCLPGRAAPKSFNNDIGVPLTLLSMEPSDRYVVVEIGSSTPGEVAHLAAMAAPDVGVITSIGHAHLEGLGGIDGVIREKLSLLDHVASGGLGLLNLDDLRRLDHGPIPGGVRLVTFGTDPQADVRVTALQSGLEGATFTINDRYRVRLPVPGAHNAGNAAAAFAVARFAFGDEFEPERIVEALATVRLPTMRLNVRRLDGLTLIEDCYNANPTSMAAGIEVLRTVRQGRRVLVAGEMMELGGQSAVLHERIGVLAARSGIDLVVSVGRGAGAIIDGARSVNPTVAVHTCDMIEQACAELPPMLAAGDTVLVKASRAVGLEKLAERIVQKFSAG